MIEQWLETVPPLLVYLTVALVIGVESIGVPLPGEVVLVAASLMSSQHDELSPVWIATCAAAGAIAGDSIGYFLGRRHGARLFAFAGRKFPRHFGPDEVARARRVFVRYGAWAVFFGRFVALLRILAGPLAGSMRMHYGRFFAANVAGGVVWAGCTTAVLHHLGELAAKWLTRFSWAGLGVVVISGLTIALVLRRRREV